MGQYEEEPTIATEVTLETLDGDARHSHPATIADLTSKELWIALDQQLAHELDPGRQVRLVLRHPRRPTQTADTIVLWHLGKNGNMVVLKRPTLWDPPSRREHARVNLALPVRLRPEEGRDAVPGMSINVSVGGMFCVARLDLIVTQRVEVVLQLSPGQSFECAADVARVDRDPNDDSGAGRLIGLRFRELTADEQCSLAETITELAADVDEDFVPRPWRPDAFIAPEAVADEAEPELLAESA